MLTLIKKTVTRYRGKQSMSLYRCACGIEKILRDGHVKDGGTKSCGCLASKVHSDMIKKIHISHPQTRKTHGMYKSREYASWSSMKQRCTNKNSPNYCWYGEIGINICPEWNSFEQFYADMGQRPARHSLDRIDGKGNYEPDNCRWADHRTQALNRNKRKLKKIA